MNRRSFIGFLAGATAAVAMEVAGWIPPTKRIGEDMSFAAQLEAMVRNLEANVMDVWEDRYQHEFHCQNGHKIIG